MSGRYRTIVADPPWPHDDGFARSVGGRWADGTSAMGHRTLPYAPISLGEIKALPVEKLADADCRLFLWTTNRYLPIAFDVVDAWGFTYKQTVVWHKTGNPTPFGGSVAPNHAEFALVAVRGKPARLTAMPSSVMAIDTNPAVLRHSQKPDAFLDYFERASPGPYAELFARRVRFGWDYPIGDQALGGVAA